MKEIIAMNKDRLAVRIAATITVDLDTLCSVSSAEELMEKLVGREFVKPFVDQFWKTWEEEYSHMELSLLPDKIQ